MLFVCYPKCSTCQKARKWLEGQGIAFDARDIKEENPSEAELRAWYARSGLPLRRFLYPGTAPEGRISPSSAFFLPPERRDGAERGILRGKGGSAGHPPRGFYPDFI